MIYLSIILLTIVFIYLYDVKKHGNGNTAYFILYLIAVMLVGFRYKLGGDSIRYEEYFENFLYISAKSALTDKDDFEPFWIGLNGLVTLMGGSFVHIQFIHAIILNSIVFYFIKKNAKRKFLPILFYFLFAYLYLNTEVLRESIAIAIFLLAYPAFVDKKWIKYYLIVTPCLLIHSSSAFLLLYPFLRSIKFNWISMIVILILSTGFYFIILNFYSYLDPRLQSKLEYYFMLEINFNGVLFNVIKFIIIPLSMYYMKEKYIKPSSDFFSCILPSYFLVATIMIYFYPLGIRLMNYFTFFVILYYAEFLIDLFSLYRTKLKYYISGLSLILVLFNFYRYYWYDTSYAIEGTQFYQIWIPYTNIFEKNDYEQRQVVEFREFFVTYLMKVENDEVLK